MPLYITDHNTGELVRLATSEPDGNGEVRILIGGVTLSGGTITFPAVQTVSGTVQVSNFPAIQAISGVITNFPVLQTISGNVVVTNFPVLQTVSGTVQISNFPVLQTVSGSVLVTNFPSLQTISGAVHVANFPAIQTIAGSVSVTNFPAIQTISGNVNVVFPTTQNVLVTNPVSGVHVLNAPTIATTDVNPLYVRGKMRPFRVNPRVTVASYGALQAISGVFALNNAIANTDRGTFLHSVQVTCVQDPSFLRLLFFDAFPSGSTFTNAVAVNVVYADQEKVAGHVNIASGDQLDSNTYTAMQDSSTTPLAKAIVPLSGTTIWMVPETRSAVTFTGGEDIDITLIFYDE